LNDQDWRTEADDEWIAHRRSWLLSWIRRHLGFLGGVGGAVSHADTGPYAGAPRDPHLRVDGERTYSTVHYATNRVSYTATSTTPDACPDCGLPLAENHEIEYVQRDDTRVSVGAVRTCRGCQPGSWVRHSQMPTVSRARETARKNVV
jgi:hypothetical protein